MSISSGSEPVFNKFYDEASVSQGSSVDDFMVHATQHSSRRRRRKGKAKAKGRTQTSFFGQIISRFSECCWRGEKAPSGPADVIALGEVDNRITDLVRPSIELGSRDSIDLALGREDSRSSGEEVPMGMAPHELKGRAPKVTKGLRRAGDLDVEGDDKVPQEIRRALPPQPANEKKAQWSVSLPLNASWPFFVDASEEGLNVHDAATSGVTVLSSQQRRFAAALWCAYIEKSERMTEKLLARIVTEAAKQPENVELHKALEKQDELAVLIQVREVQARMIQEVLGDLMMHLEEMAGSGGVYVVVSKVRTIAVSARKQGEVDMLRVFDCGCTRFRGPAFISFSRTSEAEAFISDLYENDKEVLKSRTTTFTAWTLRGRYSHSRPTDEATWMRPMQPGTSATDQEEWDGKMDDPQYEAKEAYTAMYRAAAPNHGLPPST